MSFYTMNLPRFLKKTLAIIALAMLVAIFYQIIQHDVYVTTATELKPIEKGSADKKQMALIVNVVWGNEYLPSMLETLKKNKVKVTFFVGGQWAEDNPALLKKMQQAGHDIQSHGYSHPHPTLLSKEQNKEEIVKTEKAIEKVIKKKTNLFAPAYGEFNQTVLEAAYELKYKTIYWSIDTIDWQKPSPEVLTARVVDKAHNGAIVLMHPTASTAKAMPGLIKDLKNKGYQLVTVTNLLKK